MLRFIAGMVLAASAASADQVVLTLVTGEVLHERLIAGQVANKDRAQTITQLFAQAGCNFTQQRVSKKWNNVICTLAGKTNDTVIIGAHLDFVDAGRGMVDDWTGTALLPSLFEALKSTPRHHTFQFVAFAAEEDGLVGSRYFTRHMSAEEVAHTKAFVNLECLGLTNPKVWQTRADPTLVQRLAETANAIGVPLAVVNVDNVGDDDSHPFMDRHIPVVTIHSITNETFPILHTKKDTVDVIRAEEYMNAYKLAAFYLAWLDSKLN